MDRCYNSLAWVANKLGEHDKRLRKDMIVSTGSMVACQFVPRFALGVGEGPSEDAPTLGAEST